MRSPKKILVATDFSEPSASALSYAVTLAKALGAGVHLVHAYELPVVGFPDGVVTISAEMASRIIDAAGDSLKKQAAAFAKEGVAITTSLEQAEPREGILESAKKHEADLIVVGTHGRRGVSRALIGSVAEGIVRRSTLPVLIVHAG